MQCNLRVVFKIFFTDVFPLKSKYLKNSWSKWLWKLWTKNLSSYNRVYTYMKTLKINKVNTLNNCKRPVPYVCGDVYLKQIVYIFWRVTYYQTFLFFTLCVHSSINMDWITINSIVSPTVMTDIVDCDCNYCFFKKSRTIVIGINVKLPNGFSFRTRTIVGIKTVFVVSMYLCVCTLTCFWFMRSCIQYCVHRTRRASNVVKREKLNAKLMWGPKSRRIPGGSKSTRTRNKYTN